MFQYVLFYDQLGNPVKYNDCDASLDPNGPLDVWETDSNTKTIKTVGRTTNLSLSSMRGLAGPVTFESVAGENKFDMFLEGANEGTVTLAPVELDPRRSFCGAGTLWDITSESCISALDCSFKCHGSAASTCRLAYEAEKLLADTCLANVDFWSGRYDDTKECLLANVPAETATVNSCIP